jgi:hypothetical protein
MDDQEQQREHEEERREAAEREQGAELLQTFLAHQERQRRAIGALIEEGLRRKYETEEDDDGERD